MALIGTLMTPRIDAKIRGLLSYHKFRNKHVDFKDILRERFRSKIKENRRTLLQRLRTADESCSNVQNTLSNYLHDEINDFEDSSTSNCDFLKTTAPDDDYYFDIERELELMKQIESELLDEQLGWIMEEYCKEEAAAAAETKENNDEPLLCPVCQCGYLRKIDDQNVISCTQCSIRLFSTISIEKLNSVLRKTLNEHSSFCNTTPLFTVINEPHSSGLFIICELCSSFNALC